MRKLIPFLGRNPVVPVIRLQGIIASQGRGATLNDAGLAPVIEKAFARGKPAAVALAINSPGGSPVQSALIARRIRRLADEKELPVYAFVEDVAASGGYWLACAADEIYADASSIVGSIGVISAGFGFQDFIGRYGVERRVHTSGKSKSFLDPFRAEKPEDVERLTTLQGEIHEAFIAHVRDRRGDRLTGGDELFTGEFWTGAQGQALGLVDGIAHRGDKMRDLYGPKVRLVRYQVRRPFWSRLSAGIMDDAAGLLDERALMARYGL